jgi:hypothetical protein
VDIQSDLRNGALEWKLMKHDIFHQNFTSLDHGGENYQATEKDHQISPARNVIDDQIAFFAILCVIS